MPTITKLCNDILKELKRHGHKLVDLLQPGLSERQIAELTADLPFVLPRSAVEIYTWRNGTREGQATFREMWLFSVWFFQSLENSVEAYHGLIKDLGDAWENDCFPLFTSGSAEYLGIRCSRKQLEDAEIVSYRQGDSDTDDNVEFVSLEVLLSAVLAAYRSDAFYRDEKGRLKMNHQRFSEIARQLNPGVKRWQE